jgi:membrane associated rhomboid family serine protease
MIPLFDTNKRRRTPAITGTLIGTNLLVFAYQLVLAQQEDQLGAFIMQFAFVPAFLMADPSGATALTVVTSMFLHGGLLHLVFNLWFLWVFGNMVEDRIGPFRYLFLYLVAGVGAAVAQFAVAPFSPIPMIGASGAIAGVLGAYLLYFPKAIIFTFIPVWFAPVIPVPAFLFLILWFGLQIWQGIGSMLDAEGSTGGVAWWAHFGGFVAGFFIGKLWKKKRR